MSQQNILISRLERIHGGREHFLIIYVRYYCCFFPDKWTRKLIKGIVLLYYLINICKCANGTLGICLDLGTPGGGLGRNVFVGVSNPSRALPALYPRKGNSRDPAVMEETRAKSTPYSLET
jgi:hypothetical protein